MNLNFSFYSVLKNEDAPPYSGGNLLAVADGLGGSGSAIHAIDRAKHPDIRGEIQQSAFGDFVSTSAVLARYVDELAAPMADGKDDTSALWASRIVIARCVYALTEGEFLNADLHSEKVREKLADFISAGLRGAARQFELKKGKYDGQLLLPTTLAFIRYTETKRTVIAETLWAGDSRCYALTREGLKLLSLDDEDSSGSITNLFYADSAKTVMHYIRHELSKPCVLFTASDGVFDPFVPHEHLGVEHTLLSAVKEGGSAEELARLLKEFYDGIRGDDATMAFAAFGFDDYADMRKELAKRTERILAVRQNQFELQSALEAVSCNEEDVSHYVVSRTRDRYGHIVSVLADAAASGRADIAVTPEVKKIVGDAIKNFTESTAKERKKNRERLMIMFDNHVKTHLELVSSYILTAAPIDFKENNDLARAVSDMKTYSEEYIAALDTEALTAREKRLNHDTEKFHRGISEKVAFYRNRFDDLWKDKTSDSKMRESVKRILRVWEDTDVALQYKWSLSNVSVLPETDRAFAFEIAACIGECREVKRLLQEKRFAADASHRWFLRAWAYVFNYLKNNPAFISELINPEIVRRFGINVSDDAFAAESGVNVRDRIMSELQEKKEEIVPGIVRALADDYDKVSLIDGQYNATRLEAYRAYYRMKANPDQRVKAFEKSLAALESEYTDMVNNEKDYA